MEQLTAPATTIAPETMTLTSATLTYGISKTGWYRLHNEGKVRIVKAGRRSLLVVSSVRAWLASLPDREPTEPRIAA